MAAIGADAAAQGRVTGTVRHAATGEPIPDGQVQILDRRLRAVSNAQGRFSIEGVPAGRYTLRIARIGFEVSHTVLLVADTTPVDVEIDLTPLALRLRDVVVTPGRFGVMDAPMVAQQTMTREDIETTPQVGEDVFRAVKRLPGVAAGDISTRLNVRGATDQELLVLLDGMELYEPYHLKDFDGALGIVDVYSIGGIDLATGGFSVEHGDKMTGVFAMQSRTPPPSGRRTTVGLSITNVSAMSQGAFGGGNGQWLMSARRGYLDIALALTGGNDQLSPVYWDAFGKVQYQLHRNHRVSINVLHGADDLNFTDFEDDDGLLESSWHSSYGWLTWNASLTDRVTTRTMVFSGRVTRRRGGWFDDLQRIRGPERANVDDDRVFRFAGIQQHASIDLGSRALVKVGAEVQPQETDYSFFASTRTVRRNATGELEARFDTLSVATTPSGTETAAYAALRTRPTERVTVEVGGRYEHVSHTEDDNLAPRVLAAVDLGRRATFRTSWGWYYQSHGIHELDVGDGEISFFPAERAEQVAAGIEHRFAGGVIARIEGYHRTTRDPRPRFLNLDRELDPFVEVEGDRTRFEPDAATARGLELLLRRDEGRHWAWSGSYALADSYDEMGTVRVPRTFDQRHTISLNLAYRPNDRWNLSGAFHFHSGWPITETTFAPAELADGSIIVERRFRPINAERLPAYHRIDLRVTRNFTVGGGVLQAYLDIFNLYNRKNLRSYFYFPRFENDHLTVLRDSGEEMLPLLPSVGLRFEF